MCFSGFAAIIRITLGSLYDGHSVRERSCPSVPALYLEFGDHYRHVIFRAVSEGFFND